MKLLFQLFEQIPTHFSKRTYHAKTQRSEINQGKSSIYRRNIWFSQYQILNGSSYSMMLLKLKLMCNTDTIIFKPEEMLGILYLRSLGYYKIKQGILQQNLSKYCKFERPDTICEHFNKFINTLKRREKRKS